MYVNAFTGLKPIKEEHETHFDLEPVKATHIISFMIWFIIRNKLPRIELFNKSKRFKF